jgi:hypothetical protein
LRSPILERQFMSKANKKQRHKARREAKKREARRQNSISPIKRLADALGEVECWRSGDFETLRQISFFVYKRSAGLSGVVCFLVDRGVVGLKDAFVKMQIDREEMDYMLSSGKSQGIHPSRCTLEEVRRTVAGGIRYAHENGMRLPKDWVKVASIVGGVGDWTSADISPFSREFIGHPEDLRRRLIGEPFEDFIQRKDIAFLFADNAPVMNLDTGEYEEAEEGNFDDDEELEESEISQEQLEVLEDNLKPVADALAEQTHRWVLSRGDQPGLELEYGWQSLLMALMLSEATLPEGSEDQMEELAKKLLVGMAKDMEDSRLKQYTRSVRQALQHVQADKSIVGSALTKYGPDLLPQK